MENKVESHSNENKAGRRLGVAVLVAVAAVPAFATGPTITVDYATFGSETIEQVQTMLTAILPAAAVLFGTMKGLSWLRGIL